MIKELINNAKENMCTLSAEFTRELIADENSLINTYRQMSPEYKSMMFAFSTNLIDRQIECEKDDSSINDNYLFYSVPDIKGFYKACDFIQPGNYDVIVLAVSRDLKDVSVFGFVFGTLYRHSYIYNDMDVYVLLEYIYENIKTAEDFNEQFQKRSYFEKVSYDIYVESIMA